MKPNESINLVKFHFVRERGNLFQIFSFILIQKKKNQVFELIFFCIFALYKSLIITIIRHEIHYTSQDLAQRRL
jgi:hypothetical protein